VFCYLNNLIQLEELEELIAEAQISSTVPFMGSSVTLSMILTDENIQKLKEHDMYIMLNQVNDILYPVVELIKDSDPDLYDDVSAAFDIGLDDLI
jgi:pantothenate kinase